VAALLAKESSLPLFLESPANLCINRDRIYEDKIRRDAGTIQQLNQQCDYYRILKETYENYFKVNNIQLPRVAPPPPIVPRSSVLPSSSQSLRPSVPGDGSVLGGQKHEPKEEKKCSVSPILSTTSLSPPVNVAANGHPVLRLDGETSKVFCDATRSKIHGYCSDCQLVVPVRVVRRCTLCHSTGISGITSESNWKELNGQYDGCVHTVDGTVCNNKRWQFAGICYVNHPNKFPVDCPLVPGAVPNIHSMECGVCKTIQPTVMRFGCRHFVCMPRCLRNYIRSKLDNRELAVNIPGHHNATLRCPSNIICQFFIEHHFVFLAQGKARYEHYQMLCMDHIADRMLTPESYEGRQELTKLPPYHDKKRCTCNYEHSKDGNLLNRRRCQCNRDFCWQCGTAWKPSCDYEHIISCD
jgi:hypothetical protein